MRSNLFFKVYQRFLVDRVNVVGARIFFYLFIYFFTVKIQCFDQVLAAQATKKHLRYSDKKANA